MEEAPTFRRFGVMFNEGKDKSHFFADQSNAVVRRIAASCRYYTAKFSPKDVPAFYDLSGITENPEIFEATISVFVERYRAMPKGTGPTVVVGYDARGFVLGPPVALRLGIPFVLLRKAGKNPGPLIRSNAYSKEYKENQPDQMCVRLGAIMPSDRVILIDDLIATGGTALAGLELCDAIGATVCEFASIIEIPGCGGVEKIRAWPAALKDDGTVAEGSAAGKFKDVPIFSLLDAATVHAQRTRPDDPEGWEEADKCVDMTDATRVMKKYGLERREGSEAHPSVSASRQ